MAKILMPVDGSEHDAATVAFLSQVFSGKTDVAIDVVHVAHRGFPS